MTKNSKGKDISELNCSRCGEKISYHHQQCLLTCAHCGGSSVVAAHDHIVFIPDHRMLPNRFDAESAKGVFLNWLKKQPHIPMFLSKRTKLQSAKGAFYPFWLVEGTYIGQWTVETDLLGSDRETTRETEAKELIMPIPATSSDVCFGIDSLCPRADSMQVDMGEISLDLSFGRGSKQALVDADGAVEFELDRLDGLEALHGSMTPDVAIGQAKDLATHLFRMEAEQQVGKCLDCDVVLKEPKARLVHIPLWQADYHWGSQEYSILLDGYSEEVLTGEVPAGLLPKGCALGIILSLLTAILAVVVISILALSAVATAAAGMPASIVPLLIFLAVFLPSDFVIGRIKRRKEKQVDA